MTELVHERDLAITDVNGVLYDRVRVYADVMANGRWAGVIEFLAADGALDRALPRVATATPVDPLAGAPWRPAFVTVESLDPELPLFVMDTRTLAPGWRRVVHEGGVLVYEGALQSPMADAPGRSTTPPSRTRCCAARAGRTWPPNAPLSRPSSPSAPRA